MTMQYMWGVLMHDMWRMIEHDNLSNVQTQQIVMNAKPLKIAIYKNFN